MQTTRSSGVMPNLPATITAEYRTESVLVVTLTRADRRNALNDEMIVGLAALFEALPPAVRAVILQGTGGHFSAGLDLSELSEQPIAAHIARSRMWHRAFESIEFGSVPVIAVLQGAVIGGGLELACAAHVRIADASAFYTLPEGQRGIYVGGGGSVRLPRLIGVSRMMDMMLTGRTYDAHSGQALGFSQYVVDPGRGLEKATELATSICGNAPLTNFAIIHALPRIAAADPASGYLTEALMSAIAQDDEEAKRRVRDFLAKRAAKISV
jgi:(methylthio)acryloyl-CoA hydratase